MKYDIITKRGDFLRSKKIVLPETSRVELKANYVELSADSPLNQNDSHFHPECEIYINLSGSVAFEVENHVYPISRGSVIITRPYEYHRCIYRGNDLHKHYWITFSADAKDELLGLFFDREKGKNNLITLTDAQLNECCELLNEQITHEKDTLSRRIAFLRLVKLIGEGEWKGGRITADELPLDVAKALRYMDEHLTDELDIEQIAKSCNVSVNTLERHFKSLGSTPFAMLRKKRLFASLSALRSGDTVTEAALKSGFSDYSNYIQLFKKQFGMTPLQYKKKLL